MQPVSAAGLYYKQAARVAAVAHAGPREQVLAEQVLAEPVHVLPSSQEHTVPETLPCFMYIVNVQSVEWCKLCEHC